MTVYRPNLRAKSDADILRDAKLEAMGLNPQDHDHSPHYQNRSNHDRPQMATDEMVRAQAVDQCTSMLTETCR